ncbi:prolyl oligopeptidase family serine peptidase [Planomonospora sp. ID67723]|uniref:alpha/beta hydrolase n=1 Tax=Planomonospora sp. ID67723 TaxID=2738134 RepID=UPI0018C409E3|nr:alpha/beta hydrolase family protein [Planomonospora sp. ID67723]MBG0826407.1 prolyl oligopeptidase family serine peptidase [Planomonospora sp. ID67723]
MRAVRRGLLAIATAVAVGLPTAAHAAPTGQPEAASPAGRSPSGPWPAALPGGAQVVQEKWLDSRTVDVMVSSPSVDAILPVRLLLPRGWSKQANRTWPVLYLLHGGVDNYTAWTRMTGVEELTENVDAIVVMPEAGGAGNYTDWYNYGKGGPPGWETFHTYEVRRLLEVGYRAGTRRAVSGLSMGAYGAMKYAARHPGMFRFVGAHSGIMSTRLPGIPDIIMSAQANAKQDPKAMWGDPLKNRDVWKANDPSAHARNLRGVSIYISSGTTSLNGELDPPGTPWHPAHLGEPVSAYTTRHLVAKLRLYGIKPVVNLYKNGTHSWPYWEREFKRSFPMILKALGARASAPPAEQDTQAPPPPAEDEGGDWGLVN